jgi:ubiquinone/menaquinone biosynthesis C-methylase UbiE
VVFSDISADVLDACREAAEELGVADRCEYVEAAADDLSALEDASVDAVTTRSVLIYVAEKQQALREFSRVLRPGGRVSLSSPSTALPLEGVGAELLARRSIPRRRDRRPGGETQRRLRRPPAPF